MDIITDELRVSEWSIQLFNMTSISNINCNSQPEIAISSAVWIIAGHIAKHFIFTPVSVHGNSIC